jgi:F-type H+-transporting ATPase subunit alpha
MKSVSGSLRLDLAQYRELAAFSQFGSDLDASTQKTLARGARLTELLKQSQYAPYEVGVQVAIIYAGTKGSLDKYELNQLKAWEQGFVAYLRSKHKPLLDKIEARAKLGDIEEELKQAITAYDKGYQSHG